ncbi:hypothetical protein [Bacillus sp. MUM 13]|uniref:hypothetical protein n=1 Tax=Bacillus sp. MUM 13 TaxID=1678001 RepID=UPI00147D986D|nr:hypothetical protein [Bacillus sp. MUM 13]
MAISLLEGLIGGQGAENPAGLTPEAADKNKHPEAEISRLVLFQHDLRQQPLKK